MTRDIQELLKTNEKLETEIAERKRAEEQLARYAAELRQRTEQMEADLHLAREVQQAFLPQQYPIFPRTVAPQLSALHFCHRYRPAASVGGDFFDVLALSDTVAGVFICDVMGHGVRAGLVTAMMRALVEEMMPIAADPSQFLAAINRGLLTILRRTQTLLFASAFYLVVDVASGQMRYANAGHPHPLHVRREAGIVETLSEVAPGPALGVFEDSVYSTSTSPLAVRDSILLFTDGLCEVESPNGEDYDQDHLLTAVRRRLHLPAPSLFDEMLTEIQQFAGGREFEDDVCLVGVEVARLGLQGQSIHDPLTGLFNRHYLEETLEREVHRAERNGRPVGIIMLDIDHFTRFNDAMGYKAGDDLLRGLGHLLLTHTRRSDIAYRYGGGELLLIMPEASLENTRRKAEQLREAVKQLDTRQNQFPATVSVGVAVFPQNGTTGTAILKAASAALHRARHEGRNRVVTA